MRSLGPRDRTPGLFPHLLGPVQDAIRGVVTETFPMALCQGPAPVKSGQAVP
jgi:hypothetical protein